MSALALLRAVTVTAVAMACCAGCGSTPMHRPPELAQIEHTLNVSFTTTRPLGSYTAFYARLSRESDSYAATALIEQHCLEWHAKGYTVFVGLPGDDPAHGVWVVEHADPVQLMTIFDVGSHNAAPGSHDAEAARQFMATLANTDPYVPYFIDAAGFKVKFLHAVTVARAQAIEDAVVTFDPEAYDLSNHETIVAKQVLELWWD